MSTAFQRAAMLMHEVVGRVEQKISSGEIVTVEGALEYAREQYQEAHGAFDTLKERIEGTALQMLVELQNGGTPLEQITAEAKEAFESLEASLYEAVETGTTEFLKTKQVH